MSTGLGIRLQSVCDLALPLACCATLGMPLTLSVSLFYNWNKNIFFAELS